MIGADLGGHRQIGYASAQCALQRAVRRPDASLVVAFDVYSETVADLKWSTGHGVAWTGPITTDPLSGPQRLLPLLRHRLITVSGPVPVGQPEVLSPQDPLELPLQQQELANAVIPKLKRWAK